MKKVLSIVPWAQVFPPMNGGMLRVAHLLDQLAKHTELTIITHQGSESFSQAIELFPALQSATLISTSGQEEPKDLFSFLPKPYQSAFRYRYWKRAFKGPAEGNYLLFYRPLLALLKSKPFDFVILEDISILSLASLIRRIQPKAKIIYDAHNVNTRLAKIALQKGEMGIKDFNRTKVAESELNRQVDAVLTCSELDLVQFRTMNKGFLEGAVVPNGVGIGTDKKWDRLVETTQPNHFLFCGSLNYFPNQEGLYWFCKEVFPLILKEKPTAKLMVVGVGDPGEALASLLKHPSIQFYGRVDKVGPYYQKAAMAIIPLLSGSGTRLKLLEAMGQGVAVVSTAIGAEGIDYTDGADILIANEADRFAQAVVKLLDEPLLASTISRKAFEFVKSRYDWDLIGEKLDAYLDGLDRHSPVLN